MGSALRRRSQRNGVGDYTTAAIITVDFEYSHLGNRVLGEYRASERLPVAISRLSVHDLQLDSSLRVTQLS